MPRSTLTSKGQITLPKKVRDLLHLKPGDQLDFLIQDDGRVLLQPVTMDVADLKGMLHRTGMAAVSVKEMQTAIRRRASRKA